MTETDDPTETNLHWWNERASFHLDTELYRSMVDRLRAGGDCLLPLEDAELGDLAGVDVLHMQCHLGTDTLSLARRGARAIGVDFSPVAIERARRLAFELGIDARFETLRIEAAGAHFGPTFDLVYSTYGTVTWLPDLRAWASSIAGALRPGGRVYVADTHPLLFALCDRSPVSPEALSLRYPYLAQPEPLHMSDAVGTYAEPDRETRHNRTVEWSWGLGDIVNALVGAGLTLSWLREHPESFYSAIPGMVPLGDGRWRLPEPHHGRYPLTFSLSAEKPG